MLIETVLIIVGSSLVTTTAATAGGIIAWARYFKAKVKRKSLAQRLARQTVDDIMDPPEADVPVEEFQKEYIKDDESRPATPEMLKSRTEAALAYVDNTSNVTGKFGPMKAPKVLTLASIRERKSQETLNSAEVEVKAKDGKDWTNLSRYLATLVQECKAELKFTKRSIANELVAHRWLRMNLHKDVRLKHRAYLLPLFMELVFVPTEQEILAKQVSASIATNNQIERHNRKYWSRAPPSLIHPFGRTVYGQVASAT